ncbi:ferredoxin [Bradyrhizobium sp. HKCCYLS1011]|uniref:ferredoxin n=1 Tax=Bradyrhizobium sp. HKCCYLS1011 TaxID=3420733 RepID=UPI003EB893A7
MAVRVSPTRYSPGSAGTSRTVSPKSRRVWVTLQSVMFTVGVVLVGLLLFWPAAGIGLMWNFLIPVAPALVTISPGLWRNVCPMATMHMLPQKLGISRNIRMPEWGAASLGLISVILLFIVVPMRRIGLNVDGPLTAIMLLSAAVIAFTMGSLFEMRSGWCTSLCPIHPVERLYGTNPALTFKNARCNLCEGCSNPCPDSTPELTPTVTSGNKLQQFLGNFLVGSFPGFVWGWYQVKDYAPNEVDSNAIMTAYAWPLLACVVTYFIFKIGEYVLRHKPDARATLHRIFAAAAISTYYWYRLPGPASLLPDWFPLVSHMVTTPFFFWFIVLRAPKVSWLKRPVMASNYWSSRFETTANKNLIRVAPGKA